VAGLAETPLLAVGGKDGVTLTGLNDILKGE
jgi:hypothetical protein